MILTWLSSDIKNNMFRLDILDVEKGLELIWVHEMKIECDFDVFFRICLFL